MKFFFHCILHFYDTTCLHDNFVIVVYAKLLFYNTAPLKTGWTIFSFNWVQILLDNIYGIVWVLVGRWLDWHWLVKAHCQSCDQYTEKDAGAVQLISLDKEKQTLVQCWRAHYYYYFYYLWNLTYFINHILIYFLHLVWLGGMEFRTKNYFIWAL